MVYLGMVKIILMILNKFLVVRMIKMIVIGWMFRFFFIICGDIILFLSNWIIVQIMVSFISMKGDVINVIIMVGIMVIIGLRYGIILVIMVIIVRSNV